jgi:transcriptional regulator of acetoin/glycerol metabolism
MLAGTQSALEAAIVALLPQLQPPVTTWSEGLPLCLPDEPDGTLVLKEVGRLDREDQLRLALWLDLAAGRMQVISTTSESLITLVERRAFLDLLYYRLNVIRLEIGAGR